jgi:hypothetical protein
MIVSLEFRSNRRDTRVHALTVAFGQLYFPLSVLSVPLW